MKNFVSVHEALPAINHLCEYKNDDGYVGKVRIVMHVNKPILLWSKVENDTLVPPILLESWRYVEDDKDIRQKEANDWIRSFHSDDVLL